MEMDLQKTKEAQRDTPRKQQEERSSECPLETYGGSGHSKDSPKNDSLDHRDPNHAPAPQRRPSRFALGNDAAPSRSPAASSQAIDIPAALNLTHKEHKLLLTAKRLPPVTKGTLSELDLPCIMSNINLRMDANFDRDLHFKPDLDGEKGRRKRREAAEYWEAMATEITIYACHASQAVVGDAASQEDLQSAFEPRLPAMFETLQDVLKTLVPERDHPSVMQNLDVALLMQQIQKGVLDMVGVAQWLAALLKTHCAPMRDEWADRMVEHISVGSQSQDSMEIVRGLQTLFAILEAMKLDVANHQIRAFRVLLIEDTILFLQEYFRGKIERDNFRVEASRLWYEDLQDRDLQRRHHPAPADGFRPISLLFHGLSDLLLQFHSPEGFPETFVFDSDRLWQLRACMQNLISLDICWLIFEFFTQQNPQKRYLPAAAATYASFRSRIGTLMEESDDSPRGSVPWVKNVHSIALEIARFVHAARGGSSSGGGMASDGMIGLIERALEWHLSNETELFQYFQRTLRDKLLGSTFASARKYLNMSPLAICESQRNYPSTPMPHQHYDIDRISMRLAHLGVLHWRVWAPILYVRESVVEDVTMS